MIIKILGTGCSNCKALENTVRFTLNKFNIDAEVIKEEDIQEIVKYRVMNLPALVINDNVVSSGKRLKVDDIKTFIDKIDIS
jgi:small redox-active disulfide protein 2